MLISGLILVKKSINNLVHIITKRIHLLARDYFKNYVSPFNVERLGQTIFSIDYLLLSKFSSEEFPLEIIQHLEKIYLSEMKAVQDSIKRKRLMQQCKACLKKQTKKTPTKIVQEC